jgi:lysophospholipase L1-like esterase
MFVSVTSFFQLFCYLSSIGLLDCVIIRKTELSGKKTKGKKLIVFVSIIMMAYGTVAAELTEDIVARALVDQGDVTRLQHVMAKARRDEAVTVGVIGGSITEGALASAQDKCWGALTAAWWQRTFPNSKVTFVNAGIGATCSDLAAHRVKQHLLDKSPDVVIVEFAVNDSINPIEVETLEGLVRQILNAPQQPAVLLFFTMDKAGNNKQPEHERIGRHYALPMISMRNALWPMMQADEIAWEDFEADEVHPNDVGHGYCSQMLTGFMRKVLAALPKDGGLPEIPPVPQPLISDLFEHTAIHNDDTLQPAKNEGWDSGPKTPCSVLAGRRTRREAYWRLRLRVRRSVYCSGRSKGPWAGRKRGWMTGSRWCWMPGSMRIGAAIRHFNW